MTREEADFIGAMNMCDEISNEAYKKIMCHCEEQEPCEDAISREAALEAVLTRVPDFCGSDEDGNLIYRNETASYIRNLPSVTPKPKTGRWFYDKSIENWRCSECKETPKTMGYCGSANFMVEHFKFCNHCGAKMESEDFYENLQKLEDAGGLRLRWQKEKAKWDAERIGED
jgi:hypothetical protein